MSFEQSFPSRLFRSVHAVALLGSVALGLVMLLGFDAARTRLPLELGPLTAATWGAWWIGLAAFGWELHRHRRTSSRAIGPISSFKSLAPVCVLLWTFWSLLAIHLLIHSNKLDTARPLAWPFIIVVSLQVIAAVVGLSDVLRLRRSTASKSPESCDVVQSSDASATPSPTSSPADQTMPLWMRLGVLSFVALSLYLGIKLLVTNPSSYTNPRAAYPEQVSVLAIRVFGFLYLAVGLAGLIAGIAPTRRPTLTLARAGIPIVITILIASAIFHDRFDPSSRPGSMRYLMVYVGIFVAALMLLALHRPRSRPVDRST